MTFAPDLDAVADAIGRTLRGGAVLCTRPRLSRSRARTGAPNLKPRPATGAGGLRRSTTTQGRRRSDCRNGVARLAVPLAAAPIQEGQSQSRQVSVASAGDPATNPSSFRRARSTLRRVRRATNRAPERATRRCAGLRVSSLLVAFTMFDSIVGLATGLAVRHADGLAGADQDGAASAARYMLERSLGCGPVEGRSSGDGYDAVEVTGAVDSCSFPAEMERPVVVPLAAGLHGP